MLDSRNAGGDLDQHRGFLPEEEFERVRASVPLACVDLLPWRRSASGGPELLLIRRRQRSELTGWALVGGRIRLDETIAAAARRHATETLGDRIELRREDWRRPDEVAEYRRGEAGAEGGTFDPSQHSVALNYAVEITGETVAAGEALEARWFAPGELPVAEEIVFGQAGLIGRLCQVVVAGETGAER